MGRVEAGCGEARQAEAVEARRTELIRGDVGDGRLGGALGVVKADAGEAKWGGAAAVGRGGCVGGNREDLEQGERPEAMWCGRTASGDGKAPHSALPCMEN